MEFCDITRMTIMNDTIQNNFISILSEHSSDELQLYALHRSLFITAGPV